MCKAQDSLPSTKRTPQNYREEKRAEMLVEEDQGLMETPVNLKVFERYQLVVWGDGGDSGILMI